jgi:hypothetical protein
MSRNTIALEEPIQLATPKKKKSIKLVVWDLDNTLWNGTLLEGDSVQLRAGIRELLTLFDQRGILQAAWNKLEELGVSEYFLYPQINWSAKAGNIRSNQTRGREDILPTKNCHPEVSEREPKELLRCSTKKTMLLWSSRLGLRTCQINRALTSPVGVAPVKYL